MNDNDNQISLDEESNLVQRAKTDRTAFGELYEIYFQRIYNYILHRTSDLDLTEDLTSQVFMKVMNSIDKFECRGLPFSAWLYRIAANEIASHYRKNKYVSNAYIEELEFLIIDEEDSVHDKMVQQVEQKELQSKYLRMKKALDGLKPKYSEVIVLKFFEKLDNAKIAQILDISEGNLRIRLFRALKLLREKLTKS